MTVSFWRGGEREGFLFVFLGNGEEKKVFIYFFLNYLKKFFSHSPTYGLKRPKPSFF